LAKEQLSLDLRVNASQLQQGLDQAITGLQKFQRSLNQVQSPLAGLDRNATAASRGLNSTATALDRTSSSAGAASARLTGVQAIFDRLGSSLQNFAVKNETLSTSIQTGAGKVWDFSMQTTRGMNTVQSMIVKTTGLFERMGTQGANAFGKATQVMTTAIGVGIGLPVLLANGVRQAGNLGQVMQRLPQPVRAYIGVLTGVTSAFAGMGATVARSASPAIKSLGQAIQAVGRTRFGQGIMAQIQGIINSLNNGTSSAGRFASSIASIAAKATGINSLKNALGSVSQLVAGATLFYAQQKVLGAITNGIEHLSNGIIQFNARLQTSTIAFGTLFTNEIRRNVKDVGELGGAMEDMAGKYTKAMGVYRDDGAWAGKDKSFSGADMTSQMQDSFSKLSASDRTVVNTDGTKEVLTTIEEVADKSPLLFKKIVEDTGIAKDAAESYVDVLKNYANVTPFEFPELLKTAQRMRAFGFATEETLPALNAIGNAVSAMGGGSEQIDRIGYALGQMRNSGRVYQQDMMQLANAGIDGYQILAEQLQKKLVDGSSDAIALQKAAVASGLDMTKGFQVETIRSLAKQGKIGGKEAANALLAGMQDRYSGAQDAIGNTFAGALTTIKDQSQSLIATMSEPFFNFVSDMTIKLKDILLNPAVQKATEDFAAGITGFFESIDIDTVLTNALNALMTIGAVFGTIVVPIIQAIFGLIGFVFDVIARAKEPLTNLFGAVGGFLTAIMQAAQDIFNQIAAPLGTILGGLAQGLANLINGLTPVVGLVLPMVGQLIGTILEALAFLTPLIEYIGTVLGFIGALIGGVVAAVSGILDGIIQAFMPVMEVIGAVFGLLSAIAQVVYGVLGPIFVVLGTIVGKVFSVIGRIIGGILGGPLKILSAAIRFISDGIKGMLGTIAGGFETFVNFIIDAINLLIDAYNILPFGDIEKVRKIRISIAQDTAGGIMDMGKLVNDSKSQTLDSLFDFGTINVGDMLGAGTPQKPGGGGGGGGGTNWRKTFDERLAAWIAKVKDVIGKMYDVEIAKIKELQVAEQRRYEKIKAEAERFHERIMRNLDDEKRAQSRIFEDRIEAIRDQKDALSAVQDERKAQDKQAALERELAYAVAQQASGTLDPLEAARNVVEARKALEEFLTQQQEDQAMSLLDQQLEQIDDEKTVWERSWEDRQKAEVRRFDDEMARNKQEHTDRMLQYDMQIEALKKKMAEELLAFENHVMELAKKLKKGQISAKEFIKQTHAEFLKLGYSYKQIGEAIGMSIADGLRRSENAVEKAARRLAAIIARYLATHSPAEAGPLAEEQSIWGENIGKSMSAGVARGLLKNAGFTIGIGNWAEGLRNMRPMPVAGAAGGGTMGHHMIFNFGADSVRSDRDIYALAEAVEKRVTRTLRQR